MIKRIVFISVTILLFAFFTPIFLGPTTLAVTTCTYTKLGNPAGEPTYPPECQGSGGAQEVIALAKQQLGKPYVWAAPAGRVWSQWDPQTRPPGSFDCSGLVGWSWYWGSGGKVNFPGSTAGTWGVVPSNKFKTFTPDQKSQIQPGDAIYWSTGGIHHTALYEGPGGCPSGTCIIEAQQSGVPVLESDFESRINSSGDVWLGFIRPINY